MKGKVEINPHLNKSFDTYEPFSPFLKPARTSLEAQNEAIEES